MKNSTLQKIGGLILILAISLMTNAQEYHYQEGFAHADGGEDAVPDGWTTYNTYLSGKTNHGLYTSDLTDRSSRLKDGGSWLATKPVDKAGILKAWVVIGGVGDGMEKIIITKIITGGDTTLIAEVDTSVLDTAWVELTYEINDASDGIYFIFTRDIFSIGSDDIYIDDVSITIFENTGINTFDQVGYKSYPNPVNDILILEFPDFQNRHASICDITGRIVWKGILKENRANVSTSDYYSGIYFINVVDNKGVHSNRFIKK